MPPIPDAIEDDLLRASAKTLQAEDRMGARAILVDYLEATDRRSVKLLANLIFSFIGQGDASTADARKWADDALGVIGRDEATAFHEVHFVVNLARLLSDQARYADAVSLCERAIAGGYFSAECYLQMTYAAIQSRDPKLLARSVKKLDKLTNASPKRVSEKLGTVIAVLDNAAQVHHLLGHADEVERYVGLCREYRYERFDAMPDAPEWSRMKGDADFHALFAYPVAIRCKPADEPPFWTDGHRAFVDRVWPKDVRKAGAKIKEWLHDLAPSAELEAFLAEDPSRFPEFRRRYEAELAAQAPKLAALAKHDELTLVHASKDPRHSGAEVIAELVGKRRSRSAR